MVAKQTLKKKLEHCDTIPQLKDWLREFLDAV